MGVFCLFAFQNKKTLSPKLQCLKVDLLVSMESFPQISICCSKNEIDSSDFLLQSDELKAICFKIKTEILI